MSVLLSLFQVFYPLTTRLMMAHGPEFFTMNEDTFTKSPWQLARFSS